MYLTHVHASPRFAHATSITAIFSHVNFNLAAHSGFVVKIAESICTRYSCLEAGTARQNERLIGMLCIMFTRRMSDEESMLHVGTMIITSDEVAVKSHDLNCLCWAALDVVPVLS